MRIGILGLGRIGAFHAATLAGLDAVDTLVVSDPVAAATAAAVERFGATAVDSPEAVLAAGVDGIVIAAATDAHPALILAAVKAGIPVFCEKPVARTVEESLDVLESVRDSGVEVQIGYNRSFDAGCVAARKAVVSGELGKLHTVRSTTLDPAPPPAAYVAVSGGIFRDCSVHDFDIVR
ncbi:Gfo/Idh/MocA family oxidoreductase, partial [Streptomyces sp. NPDC127044]